MVLLTLHYPNGTPYHHDANKETLQAGNSTSKKPPIEFGKRGMNFEDAINASNDYYMNHELAVIHKKPTPIQIVKVDYPRRSAAVIKEAYFRQASTTDYNGVYRGYYIDFEAKETKNKTSFPLKNFHDHQIAHMKACNQQDGVCFVLLWFSSLDCCFLLGAKALIQQWDAQKSGGKKSIPLTFIKEHGFQVATGIAPQIAYLPTVDLYIQALQNEGVLLNGK